MIRIFYDAKASDSEILPGKGPIGAKYAFVGIAPSPNRPKARRNEPFGSRSWAILNRILSAAPAGGIYLTNLIKKPHPIGKKISPRLIRGYTPLLLRELQLIRPHRILALGTEVASVLCPGFTGMRDDHGVMFQNEVLSDLIGHPVIVVPTYHFSAIGRDPLKKPTLARDLDRFFSLPYPKPPKFTVLKSRIPEFKPGSLVTLDLETEGFDPYKGEILSLSLGVEYSDSAIVYQFPSREILVELYRHLKNQGCSLQGQNFQFDLYWLTVKSDLFWDIPVEDTMLLAHNQGEHIVGLKHLTTMYTDRPGPHAFGGFQDLGYAAEDIHSTKAVAHALKKNRSPQHVDRMMWQAIPELVGMRHRGVYIDRPLLASLAQEFREKVSQAREKLLEEWGDSAVDINWNSNKQVVELFRANNIRLTEMSDSGQYTLKEAVLLKLAPEYPKVQTLLDYRAIEKTLTGFFEGYLEMTTDEHPYLHPFQDLKGAQTGRTSMRDPNLQQVTRTGPSKLIFKPRWVVDGRSGEILEYDQVVRHIGAIGAADALASGRIQRVGKFGLIDLKQAELRAACLISNDPVMAQAILSGDPHRYAASIAFHLPIDQVPADKRKKVKGVVFGKLYGGSSAGLARRIGIGVDEVEEVDRAVFGTFKRLAAWLKEIKRFGVDNLYVEDVFGRRRYLDQLMQDEGASSVARKACNTPIQALASHMAMTILSQASYFLRTRGLKTRTLFGIHDSTLLEIHPDDNLHSVHQCIQDAFFSLNYTPLADLPLWQDLPIQGELVVGNHWAAVESTSDYYDQSGNEYFECSTRVDDQEVDHLTVVSLG